MKTLLTLLTLLLSLISLAQESEEYNYVAIKWIPGTIRVVNEKSTTTLEEDGKVLLAYESETNYKITVESLQDTVYEIKFQSGYEPHSIEFQTEEKALQKIEEISQSVLERCMDKIQNFEYSILVSKNTGLAFKIINEAELKAFSLEVIEELLRVFMDATGAKLTLEEYNESMQLMRTKLEEESEALMNTAMNDFNFMTQIYSIPYDTKETMQFETEVSDYNEVQYGKATVDAIITARSAIKGNELSMNLDYEFDKAQAYDLYIVQQDLAADTPFESFEVEQNISATINLSNSWIKTFTYELKENAGNMRSTVKTTVTLKWCTAFLLCKN